MKRREFLRTSVAGAFALGLSPALLRACNTHDTLHDFGIISGVIRNELKEDVKGTLEQIAAMGYKYLEGGGPFDMTPAEFNSFMDGIGLKSLASGTSISGLQGDGLKIMIDGNLELGRKYLVCYWPWRHGGQEITMDDLKYGVDEFQRIGEECNSNGLRFAYHNHDHEFKPVGDLLPYDYFLENTDDEWVTMQMDIYWVSVGGADPVDFIKRYPGRFELLHVKDAFDLSDRESFACVGEGVIDFERIFRERETGGFKHLIVEKDGATQGIRCAQVSIDHLNSLEF